MHSPLPSHLGPKTHSATAMDEVKINIEYLKTVNYALFHNGIAICQSVELTNTSDHPVEDVTLSCTGEYVEASSEVSIGIIGAGETVRTDKLCLTADGAKLAELTERIATRFTLTAKSGTDTVGEAACEIELMPYDHWTGLTVMPQTIASFITPNHPDINRTIVSAAAILKEQTGSSSFNEYQTGNTNDVRRQVAAVFAALHNAGIIYRSLPAGFEETGQRVSMPDRVLSAKTGNCVELTLLMASALEAIGLHCLVIFQHTHAFLGVWLVDDCCPCSVSDDPSFIEKKCSRGIDEMLVVETTQLTHERASFEYAVQSAETTLADHSLFELFIDVRRSRLERIRPLPTRIEADGRLTFETTGVEHDACAIDLSEHDRYDLSRAVATDREPTKFDIWERKLLDFSLRNALLNLSIRRRAVQFISFDLGRIEDCLQNGEEYRLMPKPEVEFTADRSAGLVRSKLHEDLHELISNDIEHHLLHTYLPETESKDVLKNIYRAARNAVEETGANSLFLAIGTLRWYETDQSTTPRYAPLLLLPVEMVYKKRSYYIRSRDEDIQLNITLMEFLRQRYDITVGGLDPLPADGSGVNVPLIFALVREALKQQKRWDVEEECVLGTFSFSKFLMWNDIHNRHDLMAESPIIDSLVAGRLTWTPGTAAADLAELDRTQPPADVAVPMPVDSSQMAAVIEGGNGNSFILYGPPGTGKSQTITNLIANALFNGKRVLFVAEKMAALSVVQSRLEKIGLGPFCLELHSNKSTKRHVLQQLEKALNVTGTGKPAWFASDAESLFKQRKELLAYLEALHTADPADGLTLHDLINRYEAIDAEPMPLFSFDKAIDDMLLNEGVKRFDELLDARLRTVVELVGDISSNPLNGLHADRSMLTDDAMAERMNADSRTLAELSGEYADLTDVRAMRSRLDATYGERLTAADPDELRRQWDEANSRWAIPRHFARRRFRKMIKELSPSIAKADLEDTETMLEQLATYRYRHGRLDELGRIMKRYLDREVEEDTIVDRDELEHASTQLGEWAGHTLSIRRWIHWTELSDELRSCGLACAVEALEQGRIDAPSAKSAYLKALYRHKIEERISQSEALVVFHGMLFDYKINNYRSKIKKFRSLTRDELIARLGERIRTLTAANDLEAALLRRNISNGGRGLSLRDLFDKLPTLLPSLCPCMLMSPMSVARYIDLTAEKFDLVIFDEASQMPTSEAVGAIARGKALIVVGDPKQMPPTSFFTSTNVDTDEAAIDDMESILEDCRALGMPSLQLSWHYRSRHESLIAFSNNEYYDGSLITFPSIDDQHTKVHFVPLKGCYDKGGQRSNRAEAKAIVDEIVRRLKHPQLRQYSIGVIAFSVNQQSLIEDMLQERLDRDKSLQAAAAEMYEPIFVKNLENVQGDERDVILFSIGYGPDKDGKVSMNFGPLNNAGGERRLNVAVSRARCEMYVFSTLRAADIDLRRSKALGVKGLKHFLRYAETAALPSVAGAHGSHRPSAVATAIADELRRHGYKATVGVGRSRFRVDVAVESPTEPGTYILGLLLDGVSYRDTQTTRDREEVQPGMLKSLGWNVMRIWSVDWFNNSTIVIERILEELRSPSVALLTSKTFMPEPIPKPLAVLADKPVKKAPAPAKAPAKNRDKIKKKAESRRVIADITDDEIAEAICETLPDIDSPDMESTIRAVAKKIGYNRCTAVVASRIRAVMDRATKL